MTFVIYMDDKLDAAAGPEPSEEVVRHGGPKVLHFHVLQGLVVHGGEEVVVVGAAGMAIHPTLPVSPLLHGGEDELLRRLVNVLHRLAAVEKVAHGKERLPRGRLPLVRLTSPRSLVMMGPKAPGRFRAQR